ncbi:class I SAM-dependent methyltransferase [Candidatus Daviesbacteria bacterium]|nr:class I SAM-dependent methyltransferase [Candidatus Daviesbacteria bacterium]
MDITLIISSGILLGCLLALSWFAGSDAPYVPTKMDYIRKILKFAGVKKGRKFYELGSGDGRVVIAAAKLGAHSIGIEQSWIRVLYSKYKSSKLASHSSSGNVDFYHGNIFKKSYQDADIVYIYLLNKGVNKLEEKLRKELKKGSIVIIQTYHFPNWKPFKQIDLSKEIDFSKDIQGAGNFWLYRV